MIWILIRLLFSGTKAMSFQDCCNAVDVGAFKSSNTIDVLVHWNLAQRSLTLCSDRVEVEPKSHGGARFQLTCLKMT